MGGLSARLGEDTARNVLVTGRPGSGKTTLVLEVVRRVVAAGFKAGGFVTEEMREGPSRVGFRVRGLEGGVAVLAHVGRRGGPRVGKYGVDTEAFEKVAFASLNSAYEAVDLLVIDEIGRMELCSHSFRALLPALFDSRLPLLATVHAKRDPLTRDLLARDDVCLYTLSVSNRDECAGVVYEKIMALLAASHVGAEPQGGSET